MGIQKIGIRIPDDIFKHRPIAHMMAIENDQMLLCSRGIGTIQHNGTKCPLLTFCRMFHIVFVITGPPANGIIDRCSRNLYPANNIRVDTL